MYDAIGDTFVSRLLLPLHSRRSGGTAAAGSSADEKQAAAAALGLAVLSSFVRMPEMATSEELVQKLPLLLNVVRACGLSPLLGCAADDDMDAAALQDALECAAAVAAASDDGRAVALESGGLGAAVRVLTSPLALARTQLLLPALRLLATLLGGPDRLAVVADSDASSELLQLVPALAHVFALPAAAAAAAAGKGKAAEDGAREAGRQQQHQALPQELAALQLEALHTLLLLLPLPLPVGEHLALALAGAAPRAAWPHELRWGLGVLLRSRVGSVQRHSALQLAAAATELLGPAWALGGPAPPPGAPAAQAVQSASQPAAFYQLLVEVTRIETGVLLLDALGPSAPVPASAAKGNAAAQWRPPVPRSAPAAEQHLAGGGAASDAEDGRGGEGAVAMEEEAAGGAAGSSSAAGAPRGGVAADMAAGQASADMEGLYRVLRSESDRRAMEAQMQAQQDAAAVAARKDHVKLVEQTVVPEGESGEARRECLRISPSGRARGPAHGRELSPAAPVPHTAAGAGRPCPVLPCLDLP